MNLSEAIIDEANVDIAGARGCMEPFDYEGLQTAIVAMMTLRNICTKMNLLKLEVMIQDRLDNIGCNILPEDIFV